MNILKGKKKITLATMKAFARRNMDQLYVKELSTFNGMVDCVESNDDPKWIKSKMVESGYYRTGIFGVYTVGSSRDYFSLYDDGLYFGIEVYNSCGTSVLAVKK